MRHTIRFFAIILTIIVIPFLMGADSCNSPPTSDEVQQSQQERILAEGTSQVGMPGITNFRERRLAKQILEMRDKEGLLTYTYLWSDMNACAVLLCDSIGYGLPYSTQFTNPEKIAQSNTYGVATLPQADPNGLFSPSSAEATWVTCKDPEGKETLPIGVEPRTIVSPFRLDHLLCSNRNVAAPIK